MAPGWMEGPRLLQAGMEKLGGSSLQSMKQLQGSGYRIKSTEIVPQLQAEAKRAWWFQAEMELGSLASRLGWRKLWFQPEMEGAQSL